MSKATAIRVDWRLTGDFKTVGHASSVAAVLVDGKMEIEVRGDYELPLSPEDRRFAPNWRIGLGEGMEMWVWGRKKDAALLTILPLSQKLVSIVGAVD